MRYYLLRFVLIFGITFFGTSVNKIYAQTKIDFSFQKTSPNHSVLVLPEWHPVIKTIRELDSIPSEMILGFDDDSLVSGDLVGIFYNDKKNRLKCASSIVWKEDDFNMIPVWGEHPPGSDNGMEMGEKMIWLAQKKNNIIYQIEPTYQKPLMAIYLKDGASAVLGMKLSRRKDLVPFKNF